MGHMGVPSEGPDSAHSVTGRDTHGNSMRGSTGAWRRVTHTAGSAKRLSMSARSRCSVGQVRKAKSFAVLEAIAVVVLQSCCAIWAPGHAGPLQMKVTETGAAPPWMDSANHPEAAEERVDCGARGIETIRGFVGLKRLVTRHGSNQQVGHRSPGSDRKTSQGMPRVWLSFSEWNTCVCVCFCFAQSHNIHSAVNRPTKSCVQS